MFSLRVVSFSSLFYTMRILLGPRYNQRGVDEEGNVAAFVETEQLLITPDVIFSYVIIRGMFVSFKESRSKYKKPLG